jgi:uncharacterized protein YbaP (TraB family)
VAQDGGYLGVTYADVKPVEAAVLGWPAPRGIKVTKVFEGTAADKAGLRVGDIILTVDRVDVMGTISRTVGETTDFLNRFQAYLDLKRPGDTVEIAIFRDGQERKLTATLGQRPPPAPPAPPPACTGNDLIVEIEKTDPAGHARIIAAAKERPNAKGLLWRIEKSGLAPSHLFGTIHLTDDRVNSLSPAVKEAFRGAKRVALEIAEMSIASASQAMQQIRTLVQYSGGQSLKTELPPGEYAALQELLKKRGQPVETYDYTKPWLLVLSMALPVCEQLRQGHGLKVLDMRLADDAKARGIPVVGLETAESQLRTMASISTFSQLALLVSTVRHIDRVEDSIETLVQSYLRRDLSVVLPLQVYFHEKLGLPRSALDEFESVMLARRNHRMRDAALPLLSEGGLFIGVGSAHLPGREGLVELLRQSGYTDRSSDTNRSRRLITSNRGGAGEWELLGCELLAHGPRTRASGSSSTVASRLFGVVFLDLPWFRFAQGVSQCRECWHFVPPSRCACSQRRRPRHSG